MKQYFYLDSKNTQVGPFSEEQIKEYVRTRILNADTLLWVEGLEHWRKLGMFPEFSEELKKRSEESKGGCIGCLLIIATVFFIGLIGKACSSGSSSSSYSDPIPTFKGDTNGNATQEDLQKAADWLERQDRNRGN